jgi:hypothetical protein
MSADAPGRNCPLAYRYSPEVFRRPPEIEAETLYAIGGLYGNPFALAAIVELAAQESPAPTLVFNGDFNWFDVEPGGFAALNAEVLGHVALRGNVETEAANDGDEAGCGCAYPEYVGDADVERSNAILGRLRATARGFPALRARLGALPMHAVAAVGGVRIAIVHGDAWSLAGWRFGEADLAEAAIDRAFDAADVSVFASSHTCLPVTFRSALGVIANNGAAGMPNFRGTRYGLVTRIATAARADALYAERVGPIVVETLAVRYDHSRWLAHFDRLWPAGSPAAVSYRKRITEGPGYDLGQAVRRAVRSSAAPRQNAATT